MGAQAKLRAVQGLYSCSTQSENSCIPTHKIPVQEIYAEWVGAQAKLALLEAHAQCRAFAAGLPDQETHSLVTEAQAPFERSVLF